MDIIWVLSWEVAGVAIGKLQELGTLEAAYKWSLVGRGWILGADGSDEQKKLHT